MSFKPKALFFADVPYKIATFTFQAVPKRAPKTHPKKDAHPNASEERLGPEKASKTGPKSCKTSLFLGSPVFLAALGANLGLSCAFLARLGAHLASFLPHLGPTWTILGPTWASLAPSWPFLVPILPHLAANLSQLGPFGAHLAPSWSIFWPTCRFTLTCAGPSCLCRAFLLNSWLPASPAKLLGGGDVAPGAFYNHYSPPPAGGAGRVGSLYIF